MTPIQYEELCRLFLADKLEIPIEKIRSVRIPNPRRPGLPEYAHQIDLYWEDGNEVALYLNIANAKWRSSGNVNEGEILLLQKVKEKVGAHKSMMITSVGFDKGAKAAAEDEGVALHIVCPSFDYAILHPKNREVIQTQLRESFSNSKPPYTHEIVYRAFDLGTDGTAQTTAPNETAPHSKEIRQAPMNRMAQPTSHQRAPSGTQKVQGGQGSSRTSGRGGAVQKGTGPARGSGGRSNRGK